MLAHLFWFWSAPAQAHTQPVLQREPKPRSLTKSARGPERLGAMFVWLSQQLSASGTCRTVLGEITSDETTRLHLLVSVWLQMMRTPTGPWFMVHHHHHHHTKRRSPNQMKSWTGSFERLNAEVKSSNRALVLLHCRSVGITAAVILHLFGASEKRVGVKYHRRARGETEARRLICDIFQFHLRR